MVRKKTLRLFQKLLRLFQPERYDYCSLLLAIGRKPEKDTSIAVNGSSPPAAPLLLDCPAGWSMPVGAS
jgi:hypothetical protein